MAILPLCRFCVLLHLGEIELASISGLKLMPSHLSFQRGQPDRTQVNGKRDRGQMHISKEDVMAIGS